MRVLAAMSGGVDSAVAAARVVEAGHEVVGVHLALSRSPAAGRDGGRGCCSVEDAGDAQRVAGQLDIPFYVWDLAERFEADVIDDFVASYAAGQTPNPCLRCNERIKFSALLDKALALGFDAVATGHYARLVDRRPGATGEVEQGEVEQGGVEQGVELHRAVDPAKDQSYVLGVLDPDRLAHALFPLGDSVKTQVRAEAERRGLRVAAKPDSHDICFIPDGDTAGFLERRLGRREGPIVDVDGDQVGRHRGTHAFTVGQRRGLALAEPGADGRRRYVLSIEPVSNTVVVGPGEALEVTGIVGERPIWAGPRPEVEAELGVQLRAHGEEVPARVLRCDERVELRLGRAARGVAPGQALVLYDGTRVVGSATITSSH